MSEDAPVRYEVRGPVAIVTMDREEYRNAQNSKMTYALDEAYYRAADDDEVKVVVLAGAGKHFSAGHDIGTPGRDIDQSFPRKATLWWDHTTHEGGASRLARESEVYVGHVPALARAAEADDRDGAGRVHRRRSDAGLVVRPGRRLG